MVERLIQRLALKSLICFCLFFIEWLPNLSTVFNYLTADKLCARSECCYSVLEGNFTPVVSRIEKKMSFPCESAACIKKKKSLGGKQNI